MKKKSLLLFTLLSALSLVSCGGNSGEVYHEVDQTLPADDPTGGAVEIVFWHCLGQSKRNNLKTIVNKFNTKYAGKYHIYDIDKSAIAGDYGSLASALTTNLQSGTVPAMTMGYPDFFSDLIGNRLNGSAILRLDNFLKDEQFGYSEAEIADFIPAYYQEGTGYQFTGTWSMPMYKSTEIMYYNKSFFSGVNEMNAIKFDGNEEYENLALLAKSVQADDIDTRLENLETWVRAHSGYAYDVPTTWQQLFQIAQQIKTDWDSYNLGEFIPVGYDSDSNMMITQMAQRGIPYTTNENVINPQDHYLFNNQGTIDLVEEIKGYATAKLLTTKGISGSYSSDKFAAQKCVISIGSTGGSTYQDSRSFVPAVAPVPCWVDNEGVQHKCYIQQGPSICFFDNQNPYIHKGAWLFYKEMADTLNNAQVAHENSYDPVRKSSHECQWYQEQLAKAGQHLGLNYDIPAKTDELKDYYMTSPVFLGSQNARDQIGAIIGNVMVRKYPVATAVRTAYELCY